MVDRVRIGVIGCGNISGAYLKAAATFPILEIAAVADLNLEVASAKAAEFGLPAMPLEALYADPSIEVILNLTVPKGHVAVGLRALEAGKHVYSEKPLGIAFAEGRRLIDEARRRSLRVGCAPDTFLGGGHQAARGVLDSGAIGQPVGGTANFMCPGHERWHPNPGFYYEVGGGPMLDMGPYYITDLVNLLGPVAKVAGFTTTPRQTRTITNGPRDGEIIPVHVPTHVAGVMAFASGAVVQITMSFDVAGHKHLPIEIYGTEGTLLVPDPNRFGGEVTTMRKGGEWTEVASGLPYADGNYRSIGLADMAHGLRSSRPHRASGELALHVLEVMEAFATSSAGGSMVTIESRVERPAPITQSLQDGRLA